MYYCIYRYPAILFFATDCLHGKVLMMVPALRRHYSASFTSARCFTAFQSNQGKTPLTSVIQLYLPTTQSDTPYQK